MRDIDCLGFDHIDLTVNDLSRSHPFYERVLGRLGFQLFKEESPSESVIFVNGVTSLAIHPARPERRDDPHDRYSAGLHHLAFRAARRDDVDTLHEWLVAEGFDVLDAPAEYPQYGKDYYAVFFPDPDGIKLELVHFPWGYWRRAMTEGEDARPRYPRGTRTSAP